MSYEPPIHDPRHDEDFYREQAEGDCPATTCSALPDMPTTPGWYWVRSRIPDAPWFVCETHENENGVPEWRDDGESWPIEPNRADFVGPLIPPNPQDQERNVKGGSDES